MDYRINSFYIINKLNHYKIKMAFSQFHFNIKFQANFSFLVYLLITCSAISNINSIKIFDQILVELKHKKYDIRMSTLGKTAFQIYQPSLGICLSAMNDNSLSHDGVKAVSCSDEDESQLWFKGVVEFKGDPQLYEYYVNKKYNDSLSIPTLVERRDAPITHNITNIQDFRQIWKTYRSTSSINYQTYKFKNLTGYCMSIYRYYGKDRVGLASCNETSPKNEFSLRPVGRTQT